MKVVCISDTHNKHKKINLPEADMIICAGDISSVGHQHEVEDFFKWYNSLNYKYKILIAGNHDFLFEEDKEEIRKLLLKYNSVYYLENTGITIEGINIWGSPVQPTFHDWAFNVDRGLPIKKYWDLIPNNTDILIVHGPPFGYGDRVHYGGYSVGCEELTIRIKEIKPKFFICGHIHEGYGVRKDEHTTYINAAVLNLKYEPINEPIIFEI